MTPTGPSTRSSTAMCGRSFSCISGDDNQAFCNIVFGTRSARDRQSSSTKGADTMATMIIEGERVGAVSGETYQVKDPATGEVVDEVPKGGPEDVDRAAKAAQRAQRTWGRLPAAERRRILHRAAEHMLSKADEIAPILTREQGKTLLESRIEARRFGENIAWLGDLADKVHGEYVSLPDTGAF